MVIRQETPQDFPTIYRLVKTAFETAHVSDGKEQDFVDELRRGSGYLPALALLAEEDERPIGHIMLTETTLKEEGDHASVLLLAPLSVVLEARGRGVGRTLIEEACRRATLLGHRLVVLVGDLGYYGRCGFVRASDYGISYPGVPEEFVQVRELRPGSLGQLRGVIEMEPHPA